MTAWQKGFYFCSLGFLARAEVKETIAQKVAEKMPSIVDQPCECSQEALAMGEATPAKARELPAARGRPGRRRARELARGLAARAPGRRAPCPGRGQVAKLASLPALRALAGSEKLRRRGLGEASLRRRARREAPGRRPGSGLACGRAA